MIFIHDNIRFIGKWLAAVFIIISGCSYTPPAFSQEVISSFNDENIAVLNEELRKLGVNDVLVDDVTIDETSGVISIKLAPIAKGGTGEDFSSATADSVFFVESTGNFGLIPIGSNGQFLKVVSGSPVWATLDGHTSNVIFNWSGNEVASDAAHGFYHQTSLTYDIAGGGGTMLYMAALNTTNRIMLRGQFTKISGISTITINGRLWVDTSGAGETATLTVDVGGQSNTITATGTSPADATTSTIDVSGLSDGTTYDITIGLKSNSASVNAYCSSVTLIGS